MPAPKSASPPKPLVLEGSYCRLEPLQTSHAEQLFAASCDAVQEQRYRYLLELPPVNVAEMKDWIEMTCRQTHAIYFAVIDKSNNRCGGRQAFLRIRPEHASIEIGSILWGIEVARTRIATEAFFLKASYLFDELGYRRFEWKCNNANTASKRAAIRFGFTFEGVFRQDMIVKGNNRDTAWFSILDREWPELKQGYQDWLSPDNFNEAGVAKTSLSIPRPISF